MSSSKSGSHAHFAENPSTEGGQRTPPIEKVEQKGFDESGNPEVKDAAPIPFSRWVMAAFCP